MVAKRALIVDDSRSARVILTRLLEGYGLQVDAAESGEQALDYLRSARPDVVFMDHLMPGMDGFDVVRSMKANAKTASIPVMMYTSQEGERYLNQARKAGALGILPKTLKSEDVARALYELRILSDRRDQRAVETGAAPEETFATALAQATIASRPATQVSASTHASAPAARVEERPPARQDGAVEQLRTTLLSLVTEQHVRQQQWLREQFAALKQQLIAESSATARPAAEDSALPSASDAAAKRRRLEWPAAWVLAIALVPSIVLAVLYWYATHEQRAQFEKSTAHLATVVAEQGAQINALRAELRATDALNAAAVPASEIVTVPFREAPFAGDRVGRLKSFIEQLKARQFQGKVRVTSFIGDFCLSGSALTGYQLASENLPVSRCDLVGNPFEDALTASERQSPEFAALVAKMEKDGMTVDMQAAGRQPIMTYPPQSAQLTAGDWNRVALRNNRVEFSVVPAAVQ